jgi:hypothetical protein
MEGQMKKAIVILTIFCFALSFMVMGCGKKEQPKPAPKPIVKKAPIQKPAPPPVKAMPAPSGKIGGMKKAPDAKNATKPGTPKKKVGGMKTTK